jgi:non-ribosomal peptide synthetase component E (peptide arylation enzyme)
MRPLGWQIGKPQYDTTLNISCRALRLTIPQLLIDALNPERCLSYNDIYSTVRKITAGLRANGVQPGDCVLVMSFNDVRMSDGSTFAVLTSLRLCGILCISAL